MEVASTSEPTAAVAVVEAKARVARPDWPALAETVTVAIVPEVLAALG